MNWMRRLGVLVIAVCASVVIASPVAFGQAATDIDKLSQDPNQWVLPLGDYHATRHSKLNQINARNVGKLKVAWRCRRVRFAARKVSRWWLAT